MSKELIDLDRRYVWHPYTSADEFEQRDPLVISRAEGPYLYDASGARLFDANASWWVASLGHRHPALVRALVEQSASLAHVALGDATHEPAARLAHELVELTRSELPHAGLSAERALSRVFFADNGSTAVEVALQASAQYWSQNGRPRRTRFVTVAGGFHGETVGARSVGGVNAFRKGLEGLLFETVRVEIPAQGDDRAAWERAFARLSDLLAREGDTIAGVVLEPVLQGAAGMRVYDPAFVRAAREATLRADTFLIADEVFTGLYRTGPCFACGLAGVVPDFVCLAKALSGGLLPFGATVVSARVFEGFRGGRGRGFLYGHSYCGNPLGAAVARAVLRVMREERIEERVKSSAALIAARMERIAREVPGVRGARSLGMMGAVDLGDDGYLGSAGARVQSEGLRRGIYLRPLGATAYVTPPLNTEQRDLEGLLDAFEESVREAARAG